LLRQEQPQESNVNMNKVAETVEVQHLVVEIIAAQVAEDGEDDVCREGKAREVDLGVACTA